MGESSFIYRIISAAAQSIMPVMVGICLESLLTGHEGRGTRGRRLLAWSVFGMLPALIKCLVPELPVYYSVLHTFLVSAVCFLLLYFYQDRLWIRLLHAGMLVMLNVCADVFFHWLFGPVNGMEFSRPDFGSPYIAERCMMIAALTIVLNGVYTVAAAQIQKRKKQKASPVWFALMLQLLFGFVVICALKWPKGGGMDYWLYFLYLSGLTALEFGMVMLYLGQTEKREIEEKVLKLREAEELEKAYYEQVEARRGEMLRLSGSYQQTAARILEVLEQGNVTEAEQIILDLSVWIRATKEYPFCAIPIVNAILTEKQKLCETEGISFQANLLLPDETGIAKLDLCMIFGNLLDNAVRACKEAKANGKTGEITLRSGIAQGYLIIKCENTALENQKNKICGTGYGHKILADMARKYSGDFQTLSEDGWFTAQISLKLE